MRFFQSLFGQKRQSITPKKLLPVIYQFVQADTQTKKQLIAEQHPELFSDEANTLLGQLAQAQDDEGMRQTVEADRSLLRRCREIGIEKAFAEMPARSSRCGLEVPSEFEADLQQIQNATERYMQRGDRSALDQATNIWQHILRHPAFARSTNRFQLMVRNDAGIVFLHRYQCRGQIQDLNLALDLWQHAVHSAPSDSPDLLPDLLDSLGNGLLIRYNQTGALTDLEEAIHSWRQAVQHTPSDSPDQSLHLANLGLGLRTRYNSTGDLADLEEAVRVSQQAVANTPPDSPERLSCLTNLGLGLRARYSRTKALTDLNEAIRVYQQAVLLAPPDSPSLPSILNNLGTGLKARYHCTGTLADLDEAIRSWQQAAQRTLPDSPNLPSILNNLGTGLRARYHCTKTLADLDEVIRIYQQAIFLTPPDSPNLYPHLTNLGNGLSDRYIRIGVLEDLQEAIRVYRQACQGGLETSLEIVLLSGRNWGNWALERQAWGEAVEAFGYVYQAIEQLLHTQLLRASKEVWLREVQGIPAHAAYAQARAGNLIGAVEAIENGCTRLLAESLEQSRRDLESLSILGYHQVYDQYRKAVDNLAVLQSRYRQLEQVETFQAFDKPRASSATFDPDALCAARAEMDAAIEAIREVPGYADFFRPFEFVRIQKAAEQSPLVYLAAAPAGSLTLIVGPGEPEVLWLDFTANELEHFLVQRDGENITGGYLPGQLRKRAWLEAGLQEGLPLLGERLIAPLVEMLRVLGARSVGLIPAGRLSLLPLHAAAYPHEGQTVHFLDEFDVFYTPSAQALATARNQSAACPTQARSLVGVGNPLPHPKPLPYAQAELEEIAALFGSKARPLYAEEATKNAFLAALPGATYVHLACHGAFDPMSPLDSALQLANQEELTLREVLDEKIFRDTRLIALSACQTAITDFNSLPDEAVGFPAGLLQAGVPGVVGTLWSVDDLTTALVMIKFYEYALGNSATGKEPLPLPQALCTAQRWLRDVTAGELLAYFEQHKALHDARRQQQQKRMPEKVAAEGVMRFAWEDPESRPYQDKPYYWAPFVFFGV